MLFVSLEYFQVNSFEQITAMEAPAVFQSENIKEVMILCHTWFCSYRQPTSKLQVHTSHSIVTRESSHKELTCLL